MSKPRIRIIDNVYYIVRTDSNGHELTKKAAIENGQLVFGANGKAV
jgi:hypothetical protein